LPFMTIDVSESYNWIVKLHYFGDTGVRGPENTHV
jgi:hypothetical protein